MSALPKALSFSTASSVLASAATLIGTGELNLAGVERADSAGVSLLLELTRRAQAAGKTLTLRDASAQIRSLATFFGVDSLLNFQ